MLFPFLRQNNCSKKPIRLFCLCVLSPFIICFAQNKKTQTPNIVFLLVDDMGYSECGFNGGKEISTPVIDRLANEGTVLENSYVQPVCSPTRAALLTGRYPTHTGVYTIVSPGAKWGLPLTERTLADALRAAGYQTAITGKWHLGEFEKAYQPNARGFDQQYGFYFGNIDYFTHERNKQPDWYRNGIALKEEGYSTHLIAKEACRIIETSSRAKPFFLYVPFNGIHAPYQAPEKYLAPYATLSGNRQKLAGMLAAVDEAIGEIVSSIDKAGIRENTLIVFLSDNGAPPPGINLPLRDFKASIYEGGIRGASFVNWPGHVPKAKRITEPMHVIDWYPTLVKLAGATLAQTLPLDGLDIWPMITASAPSPHDAILSVSTHGPKEAAIRMGNWKLIALGADDNGPNEKPAPKMLAKYGTLSLYNLAEDPGETQNLASQYPDRVAAMKRKLSDLLRGAVPTGAAAVSAEKDPTDQ
ncbi:MAG: arylsulfatase [Chitinophagaceae bacterium]|nr:MAG: arylsulfatase [Chitinophagaceae bacterium]